MSLKKIVMLSALIGTFICVPSFQLQTLQNAFAGEKDETALTMKAKTEKLSGINLFIANLYNEDRVLYAALVTVVMAVLGTSLAFLTDLALKALGLEVARISHRE
jgi:ABC-type phosphate/phosphonate transport system permease subunit